MSLIAVSASLMPAPRPRADDGEDNAASQAQPARLPVSVSIPAVHSTAPQQPLMSPRLYIELDEASDRFVQTIIDAENKSVLRRFPDEGQLAFSRGVNAYMRAMREA